MSHTPSDREKAGLAVIEQLGWGQNEGVRELDEDLWRLISETIPCAGLPRALSAMALLRKIQKGAKLEL